MAAVESVARRFKRSSRIADRKRSEENRYQRFFKLRILLPLAREWSRRPARPRSAAHPCPGAACRALRILACHSCCRKPWHVPESFRLERVSERTPHPENNNRRRRFSPGRGARVVQVTARVICGRAASNCWQSVVLPPPDGAEISTSKGLVVGIGFGSHQLSAG